MKKIIIIALLLIPETFFAQDAKITVPENYAGGSHGKLVVMCGFQMNDVVNQLGLFIQQDLKFSQVSDINKSGMWQFEYMPKVSIGKTSKIIVRYNFDTSYKVKTVFISGTITEVVKLFVRYWNTTIDLNTGKDATAVRHLMSDVITLKTNRKAGTATILVSK